MNSPKLYVKPPEVIRCKKKGNEKSNHRVLKSFCLSSCENRNGCETRKKILNRRRK